MTAPVLTRRDPVLEGLREQISDADRAILDALNLRLELVRRMKRYKEGAGLPFIDRAREEQLLEELSALNSGPLSTAALRELFGLVLALTKREVARLAASARLP